MSDKPTYLSLLNAVAEAEWRAFEYLSAWLEQTGDESVAAILRTVCAREGEHGMAFAKRLDELGYQLRSHPASERDRERGEVATSARGDLEKLEALGYGEVWDAAKPDIFDTFFADRTIDPVTGALLGRYIAEERDSERLLRACCAELRAGAGAVA